MTKRKHSMRGYIFKIYTVVILHGCSKRNFNPDLQSKANKKKTFLFHSNSMTPATYELNNRDWLLLPIDLLLPLMVVLWDSGNFPNCHPAVGGVHLSRAASVVGGCWRGGMVANNSNNL